MPRVGTSYSRDYEASRSWTRSWRGPFPSHPGKRASHFLLPGAHWIEDLIPDQILTCNFLLGIMLLEASLYWKLSVCSSNRVCDESEHLRMDFVDELGVRKDASYACAGGENPAEAGGGARRPGVRTGKLFTRLGVGICTICHKFSVRDDASHPPPCGLLPDALWGLAQGLLWLTDWERGDLPHLRELRDTASYGEGQSIAGPLHAKPAPKRKVSSPIRAIGERNWSFFSSLACLKFIDYLLISLIKRVVLKPINNNLWKQSHFLANSCFS